MKQEIILFSILRVVTILLICTVMYSLSYAAQKRETKCFEYKYRNIYTGYSTYERVVKNLGQPLRKERRAGAVNYHFKEVIVNFTGQQNAKVNTIQITNDHTFRSPDGIKLNDDVHLTAKKLNVSYNYPALFSKDTGVNYWHDGEKIIKIVLPNCVYIN